MAVARAVAPEHKNVALLHDVLEDNKDARLVPHPGIPPYWRLCLGTIQTPLTTEESEALLILTHVKGESYSQYIDRIRNSGNSIAVVVKRADLTDNLGTLPHQMESLRDRYEKALAVLA
jgi:hypothetical protein